MWHCFREDARFYHRLRRPHRPHGTAARLAVMLSSRGLWVMFMHRSLLALHEKRRANAGNPVWRVLTYLSAIVEVAIKLIGRCELLPDTRLDAGIYVSDRGYIMLGARRVGRGSVIHHNVTVGVDTSSGGLPEIQEAVWIGPDSILFGGITIGAGSTILPGSVLTKSVPARVVVQGNPGRIIRREFDNRTLLETLEIDATAAIAMSS